MPTAPKPPNALRIRNKHLVALRMGIKGLRFERGLYTGVDERKVAEIDRNLRNLEELRSIVAEYLHEDTVSPQEE